MGYTKRAIHGISWMGAFRTVSRIVSLARIIVLARILTPAQFGIFGIASLVLSLLEIIAETGINTFLIQEKRDIKSYINSAWVISIARGCIIAILIIISSPFIAFFFDSSEVYPLVLLVGVVPLIRGFINPSIVRFQKELEFNKEFFMRLAIFLLDSAVAVVLAISTRSVVSFVWGLIAGALLEVLLSFVFIKPLPRLEFNFSIVKKILHKGKWVTLSGIFNYLAQEGDDIVVGKILGTTSLGIYQMGYKLATLPISEISDVINKVAFPVFAKISDDRDRLFHAFKKTTFLIFVTSMIGGGIIFFLPREFFISLLGSQWNKVVDIIHILVIYGIIRSISGHSSALFLGVGRQDFVAGITFLRFSTLIIFVIPLTLVF